MRMNGLQETLLWPATRPAARHLLAACGMVLATLLIAPLALAEDEDEIEHVTQLPFDAEYSRQGADSCLKCHDEDSEFPVMAIFRTPHGVQADSRTPFGDDALHCESCHGPGGEHAGRLRRGETRPAILGFDRDSSGTTEQRNAVCMTCHDKGTHREWQGSEHEVQGLECTSCHQVHVTSDPVMSRSTEAETCFSCHAEQRADSFKYSAHPVRYGAMACSDCHEPHSSMNPASLKTATVNETCFTCHAEKRGPYLWEHAPATEDCASCHEPHGSGHPDMLTQRPPLLCQSCHSSAGHPSLALSGDRVPPGRTMPLIAAGSCTNCHSQVHGSNHPSGASLNR